MQRSISLIIIVLLFIMTVSPVLAVELQHTFAEPAPFQKSFLDTSWYARINDNANVYGDPTPSTVVRNVGDGFLYSTLHGRRTAADGSLWYQLNHNEYVRADDIKETDASEFQGTRINRQPSRMFGWLVSDVRPSNSIGGAPNMNFLRLSRYDFFQVYDIGLDSEGWVWYNVGGGRWIKQIHVSLVDVNERPEDVGANDYWVEVDLYEQTFAAYEGDIMVYAGLVSSGLKQWPTREGLFQVWERLERTKMSGSEGQRDYYFIEEVPHTMYFDGEIALHGAYWHDGFGYKHSHGCVNMPPRDSEWVFNWSKDAPADLWVWVHTSDPKTLMTQEAEQTAPSLAQVLSQTLRLTSKRAAAPRY